MVAEFTGGPGFSWMSPDRNSRIAIMRLELGL